MQKSHHKRGPVGGKLVDAGQNLLAVPGFIPNMVEGVGQGIIFAFGYFLQARTADGAGDPQTVAPTFEKDCRALVAPMDRLAFGTRKNRFPSRDHGRQPAVIRLVGHAQNHCRRPSHSACYRARLASGRPIIDASERRPIDPGAETQRRVRHPVEFRMAVEPGAEGLVRRFVKNQRQRFGQNLRDGHAKAASALNIGCH
jgi:hypothetical protein